MTPCPPPSHQKNSNNITKRKGEEGSTGDALPPPPLQQKNIKNPKNNSQKSSFIAVNIRGLVPGLRRDKLTFISALADEMKTSYILITESHLNMDQDESESFLPGWSETRSDRNSRSHGGVISYSREHIGISNQFTFSNGHMEIACFHITEENSAIVNIYRPPDCPTSLFVEGLNKIIDWISNLEAKLDKSPTIVISGDFNFPDMKTWTLEDIHKAASNVTARSVTNAQVGTEREQVSRLIEVIKDKGLIQEVEVPTRGNNTLDLIFCNNDDYIDSIETVENIAMSDHKFIIAHLNKEAEALTEDSKMNFCSTKIPEFNLKIANSEEWKNARDKFTALASDINTDSETSANDIVKDVIKALELTVTTCFKKSKLPDRSSSKSNSLIPKAARTLLKKKLNASKSLQKAVDPEKVKALNDKIFEIEEELRKLVHKRRSNTEYQARAHLKENPIPLFNLVKKLSKKTSKIGPLKRTKVTENWTEANILNRQYKSVFTVPDPNNIFDDPKSFFQDEDDTTDNSDAKLNFFSVNESLVSAAIDKLPPKAAPGPDGIPTILLKQLKFELTPVLAVAFAKSLDSGEVPEDFLKAFIIPIKKPKKPKGDPASYRPVSLTSNLAKVLEHLVKVQLQSFLEQGVTLNPAQHGFRPNRSCLTQLLDHYDVIMRNLEEGRIYDTIYLDFAKAFDTVDRFILAREMKKLGIQQQAATWLFQFLDNRIQNVIAENKISLPESVTSGVPQGTVLGPQLFLILINSLSEEDLSSRITMFADDTRVSHGIQSEDNIVTLQNDLDKIFQWQKCHNMFFNQDKFELVRHGNNFRSTVTIPRGHYLTDDGTPIKLHAAVRDLGIQVSEDSNFSVQIAKVCQAARSKANWVYRSFYSRDVSFLAFMWRVYIQPILDYGSQLWAPLKQLELKQLEDIFRNYSNRAQVDNKEEYDFWDRIRRYGILSQQRRAERFRIICVWKIIECVTPNCGITWFTSETSGRFCNVVRSPYYSSVKIKSLRRQSFQARAPELFNSLPYQLRMMSNCSVNTFKNCLDKFLRLLPDTPLSQKYHPTPMDWFSSMPSNSIIDWIKLMGLPTMYPHTLETMCDKVRSSAAFIDHERERPSTDHRLSENRPADHFVDIDL